MAEKRMFSNTVVSSDAFSDLPLSAQALYFHLGMATDDDGFVACPNRISRAMGASGEDLDALCSKGFVIRFDTGVVAIAHHKMNNTLRNDRYKETVYQEERAKLEESISGLYRLKAQEEMVEADLPEPNEQLSDNQLPTNCQPPDNQLSTNGQPLDDHVATQQNGTERNAIQPNPTEIQLKDYSCAAAHGALEEEGCLEGRSLSVEAVASEVVGYLNDRVGSSFKSDSKETVKLIRRRVAEGYGADDFKRVIENKAAQWINDPTMARYLRPKTLFGDKFESYVNEKEVNARDYSEYD